MSTKLITFRIIARHPFLIAKIEEGVNTYPSIGAFRYNYKSYKVPSTFDNIKDLDEVATLYLRGFSSNSKGTIEVLADKKFKKVL